MDFVVAVCILDWFICERMSYHVCVCACVCMCGCVSVCLSMCGAGV